MLLTQLEYFVAIARERHFGRAAEACHISQSALSEALHKLEVELDVRLIRRGHAFEDITPDGRKLLPWAQRIVADQRALAEAARSIGSALSGRLRLGVVPSATSFAANLVQSFTSAIPAVTAELETGLPSEEILRRIRRFELDAGVMYPSPEPTPDLTVALLYQERQRVLMSRMLAGDRTRIRAAELPTLPIALLSESMQGRRVLDDALLPHGITLAPQVTTDSVEALLELARTGKWAGVAPFPPASPHGDVGDVVFLELVDPSVSAPVVLTTLAIEPVAAPAKTLMQFVRAGDLRPSAIPG